jgi:hypothetical protein
VMTVFITSFSFLLAFRLNYSYQRVRTYSCYVELQSTIDAAAQLLIPCSLSF